MQSLIEIQKVFFIPCLLIFQTIMPCGQDHEHSEACGHGAAGLTGEEMGIAYSLYQVPRALGAQIPWLSKIYNFQAPSGDTPPPSE